MHMVFHSAVGMHKESMVSCNSRHVGPQPGLHGRLDDLIPFFCAENDVKVILGVGKRQCVAPPGLFILYASFPDLPVWANSFRFFHPKTRKARALGTPALRRCFPSAVELFG